MTTTLKIYSQREADGLIAEAIRQDREFQAQILHALPMLLPATKKSLIENPNGLKVFLSGLGRPKTPETVKETFLTRGIVKTDSFPLKALIDDTDNPIDVIKENVAKSWGIDVELFRGETRGTQNVCDARMMAMHLCRKCGMTSTEIGQAFARDHATVLSAAKSVSCLIEQSSRHRARYERSIELITQCCRKRAAA